jgi:ankyrin repeat protein
VVHIAGAQTITLNYAISKNDVNTVRELLEKGSSLHKIDRFGNTPLTIASYHGNVEIVKLLVEYGAMIDESDRHGNSPLIVASMQGHYAIVKYFIDQGADLNYLGKLNRTALMHAVSGSKASENLDVIKQLTMYGADPNIVDDTGRSALDYAHDDDVKTYLIGVGALTGRELNE